MEEEPLAPEDPSVIFDGETESDENSSSEEGILEHETSKDFLYHIQMLTVYQTQGNIN